MATETLVTVATWRCLVCTEGGTGDPKPMDREAEKHTKDAKHGTTISTKAVKPR